MVVGSTLGELKLSFIFVILGFWLEFEGLRSMGNHRWLRNQGKDSRFIS